VTEFRYGDKVVLIPKVFPDLTRPANLESIARYNKLHLIWVSDPVGLFRERWNERRLRREYVTNPLLRDFYADLLTIQELRSPGIVLIMGDGGYWHPDFLARLRRRSRIAFWTADDPEASPVSSLPYVRFYDHVFCGGIYFSPGVRITEKFLEMGAPKATFIPLGGYVDKYQLQGERSDEEFFVRQRDIDVIYIGAAYKKKLFRILLLKRYFGDRLFLAGKRWNGIGLGLKGVAVRLFTKLGGLGEIREVTEAELVALYQRAKIGFNCHLSYGPSNVRMYELPLNGVFHLCDCPDGLSELYKLGEEVVAYQGLHNAIEQIEQYLKDQDARVRIAKAGYRRALRDYRTEDSFRRLFEALGPQSSSIGS
jgi:hypothetical protein